MSEASIKNIYSSFTRESLDVSSKLDILIELAEEEVKSKQQTISRLEEEIIKLRSILDHKNELLAISESKLSECQRQSEGNKQLTNKLLNDLRKLQTDLDWYKRTYEKRSLLGVLREKMFRRFR